MPYMAFEADLKKLGLSDKEAAVYLASLGLGPSPVQTLSRKSKVARATTYLVLESLMKMGLITKYEEGTRTMYVAEPPRQLNSLLDDREKKIEHDRKELDQLLPKLQAFMKTTDDKPVVRYYGGVEGLKNMRSEMVLMSKPNDMWYQLTTIDHMRAVYGENFSFAKQRKALRIQSKAIVVTKSKEVRAELEKDSEVKWAERKFVDPSKYTSTSGFTVMNGTVVIGMFGGKMGGVIIESESVATMMKELFMMAWDNID